MSRVLFRSRQAWQIYGQWRRFDSAPEPFSCVPGVTLEVFGVAWSWLGGRDLNPDNVVQSHVSYR